MAVSSAIQRTPGGSAPEDGRNPESETSSDTPLPPATEDGKAGAPTMAVPENHPTEDRPASEEPLPVPPPDIAASNDKGGSVSSDILLSGSESPRLSEPSKAPASSTLIHRRIKIRSRSLPGRLKVEFPR